MKTICYVKYVIDKNQFLKQYEERKPEYKV